MKITRTNITKAAFFIDQASSDIDWRSIMGRVLCNFAKLTSHIESEERVQFVEKYSFDATPEGGLSERHRAMSHQGFRMRVSHMQAQTLRDIYGTYFQCRRQVGVDTDLCTTLRESYKRCKWKCLVLAANDGDFVKPIQRLVEEKGVRVVHLGLPEHVSGALKPYISCYYDLRNFADTVTLDESPRLSTRPSYVERGAMSVRRGS